MPGLSVWITEAEKAGSAQLIQAMYSLYLLKLNSGGEDLMQRATVFLLYLCCIHVLFFFNIKA